VTDESRPQRSGLPRLLGDAELVVSTAREGSAGVAWKLEPTPRQLDANIVHLTSYRGIDMHTGPELDVLILVLDGGGELLTDNGSVELTRGSLVWLPRLSRRGFQAHIEGLTYFTVHQKRPGLSIGLPPRMGP
jgi:quercetin dioxygenase-like cupin family protein